MTTYYWTNFGGSSANWSTAGATNHWALTSGGVNGVGPPTTGDDVIFDANSNSVPSTIDASISLRSLDTNGYTSTLTHNGAVTLTITGDDSTAPGGVAFRFGTGMTYTALSNTRLVSFTSTSGNAVSINSGGKTLGSLTLNGAGGSFKIATNDLTVRSDGTTTLTAGTFDANGFNFSTGTYSSSNSNTRTTTQGSGTWTITGTSGNPWDYSVTTGLTHNKNTATTNFTATAAGSRAFVTGGKAFATVGLSDSGTGGYTVAISGAGTIDTLNLTAPVNLTFANGTTFTITNALNWTGTSATSGFYVASSSGNSAATLSLGAGGTITYAALRGLTFSSASNVTATNSFDLKGNTISGGGTLSITGPSGGGGIRQAGRGGLAAGA